MPGADRYLVHIVRHADSRQPGTSDTPFLDDTAFLDDTPFLDDTALLDGTPLSPAVAERISCDASTVTHVVGREGEALALGRRTRTWSTAQHRAISIRDGGTCRFPGCTNRITDIHHLHHWATGGATDIDNGLLLCQRHHTLTHEGYSASGDANGEVTFQRPNGTTLGATRPRPR